jgi:hypothetical protein
MRSGSSCFSSEYYDPAGLLPFDETTTDSKARIMFVLSQDRNTGYSISHAIVQTEQYPPAVQEVFNSFELVA